MGKAGDTLAPRDLELGPLSVAGAKPELAWRHWKLARDPDGLAWLVLDKAGASANTLSKEVLTELDDALTIIERELPRGVVLRSAKPGGTQQDRKSTRLNSSHLGISYAVFCLKKKKRIY